MADDIVYPVHFMDDLKINRILVNWLLHFNDVIAADKLHGSLARLLEIGDWRKLGGRLRTKKSGKLEIHAPRTFTTTRPPFSYYHETHDMRSDEHPLAEFLGRKTKEPSIQPMSVELRSLTEAPGLSDKFGDWVNNDTPMISIRIDTFTDATTVGLTWAHTIMDASGVQALLKAWSLVLAGKEDAVPPLEGVHEDLIEEAVQEHRKDPEKEYLELERHRLNTWGIIGFGLRFLQSYLFCSRPTVRRVYLPADAMKRLRAQAVADADPSAEKGTFLSDNSILAAWFGRIQALGTSGNRPMVLFSFLNARFRIPQIKSAGTYFSNMIIPSYTFLSHDLSRDSVGKIALEQQTQIAARATEGQTLAFLEMLSDVYHNNKNPFLALLFGERNGVVVAFNNLTKTNIIQSVDFSPAVVKADSKPEEARSNPSGSPTHYTIHVVPGLVGSFLSITGKDHDGGYWFITRMEPHIWPIFEQELSLLSSTGS